MRHRFAFLTLTLVMTGLVLFGSETSASQRFGGDGTTLRGKFRALVVWVQDYAEWAPLSAPKKDAERIAKALIDRYLFDKADVEILGNPNQAELFKAVKGAAVRADEGDSLLIVFSGHGYLENETGQGYWIPRDGKRPGPAAELTYLSSSWVRDVLKGSKALHVAVVSDSCFSGALLGSRGERGVIDDAYYGKAYIRRSFEALTSGALETVDDTGAPGGHSPFAYYLASALEAPDQPVFDIQDLFQRVRSGVKELSKQTPLFGKLAGAPSDGGAFVFVSLAGVAMAQPTPGGGTPAPTPVAPVAKPAEPVVSAADDAWTKARAAFGDGRFGEALKSLLKGRLCEGGKMQACFVLGNLYEGGLGTRADAALSLTYYKRAAELAKEACAASDEEGCLISGLAALNGWDGAPDPARGKTILQHACDLGAPRACHVLAGVYAEADDKQSAVALWEKGCETGEPESCFRLGEAHENGWGVARSDAHAVKRYREACEGGYLTGCADFAAAMWLGQGTVQDGVKAYETAKRACDGKDDRGCTVLAMMLAQGGAGVKKDEKRAASLWQTSCERSFGQACFFFGAWLVGDGRFGSKPAEAVPWLTRGCDLNDGESCGLLGRLYDEGKGVDWDSDKGKALLKKACDLGLQSACEGGDGSDGGGDEP